MTRTILTNAKLVLEDEVVTGTLTFDHDGIVAVDTGLSHLPTAINVEGDYVTPGIVEMHTDNMEKHFVPRPGVFWPNGLAAALAQLNPAGGIPDTGDESGRHAKNVEAKKKRREK